jgi:hypothetical protein
MGIVAWVVNAECRNRKDAERLFEVLETEGLWLCLEVHNEKDGKMVAFSRAVTRVISV